MAGPCWRRRPPREPGTRAPKARSEWPPAAAEKSLIDCLPVAANPVRERHRAPADGNVHGGDTAGSRRAPSVSSLARNTHPGVIRLDGDTASGRTYVSEVGRGRDGRGALNYAIHHDRYQRTDEGWRFAERVYEVRYEDASPLTGSPSRPAGDS
ncbi:nuclear transport factor 2 family protein [Streptomyces sp. LN704]|uniref:nuclear transport factor 2 family protein n=1 Tax=Streptomyces sp. LN704 TaxID=3112982 RepID=UPI003716ED61